MRCDYFEANVCRSCTAIQTPYQEQLAAKQERAGAAVPDGMVWEPPVPSAQARFRNKAKMVAGGTVAAPMLEILGPDGVQDLRECPLHEEPVAVALNVLADFVTTTSLVPYDVPTRRGELKYILVTGSPSGELLVRFVLRSSESVPRIRKHFGELQERLPNLAVASVNLHPTHSALVEGTTEILLTERELLSMRVGGFELGLRPQGFFQTNTAIATQLYALAAEWTADLGYTSAWDLYSGVGGFALHVARPGAQVIGIETSRDAVLAATASAKQAGRTEVEFVAADATEYALKASALPELVVVNPPRRGIGASLAHWLQSSTVRHVLYSSCNVDSLAWDLAQMPSLQPVRGRVLDMFPHTDHFETLVLLSR